MGRVLVASIVDQPADVVATFLTAMQAQDTPCESLDFLLVDTGSDAPTRAVLDGFTPKGKVYRANAAILEERDGHADQTADQRPLGLLGRLKTSFMSFARDRGYDALLVVDCDVILHRRTLDQLLQARLDIVAAAIQDSPPPARGANNFWFNASIVTGSERLISETSLHAEQTPPRTPCNEPGLHLVGGAEGCLLISRRVLDSPATFLEIPQLELKTADNQFALRAAVAGFRTHVETRFPALRLRSTDDFSVAVDFINTWPETETTEQAATALLGLIRDLNTRHYLRPHRVDAGGRLTSVVTASSRKNPESIFGASPLAAVCRAENAFACTERIHDGAAIAKGEWQQFDTIDGVEFQRAMKATVSMRKVREDWIPVSWQLERPQFDQPSAVRRPPKTISRNRVLVSMLVHNEADRYLARSIESTLQFAEGYLVVDDASTDNSVAVCKSLLGHLPHEIIELSDSEFHAEHRLRRKQWEISRQMGFDWILVLDADEVIEARASDRIRQLINQDTHDFFGFNLFDFWSESHYRDDEQWSAHNRLWPFLARNDPWISDRWVETEQHCGRFPAELLQKPLAPGGLRVKHMGWARLKDRERKAERYKVNDPDARFGVRSQYDSILDRAPNLVEWRD